MRYAIESDSPDNGRSTYPECWGHTGARGRVLAEADTLERAVELAHEHGGLGSCVWIWDRRINRRPSDRRIRCVTREEGGAK